MSTKKNNKNKTALVLSGGGARGAYQVGVLKGIYEMADSLGKPQPFKVISGTSAGSLNAAHLAAFSHQPKKGIKKLSELWGNCSTEKVYRIDSFSIIRSFLGLMFQTTTGSISSSKPMRSLLETSPLRKLIEQEVPFKNIQKNIDAGHIDSLTVTALNYSAGVSYSFYQCNKSHPWERHQRFGLKDKIGIDHVMASTAIPILFPPIQIGDQYFGDGNLRNYTPLSSSIRLNANKILAIGTRRKRVTIPAHGNIMPTPARILGMLLNSLLLDSIDLDYERVTRINDTLTKLKPSAETDLSPIDVLLIRPSQELDKIAFVESPNLPKLIQFLVRGLGTQKQASDIISYILFESKFTKRLIELGYKDAYAKEAEIRAFLSD